MQHIQFAGQKETVTSNVYSLQALISSLVVLCVFIWGVIIMIICRLYRGRTHDHLKTFVDLKKKSELASSAKKSQMTDKTLNNLNATTPD